jgi:hypothetical protein
MDMVSIVSVATKAKEGKPIITDARVSIIVGNEFSIECLFIRFR